MKAWGNLVIGASSAINSLSYTKPAFEMLARNFSDAALGRSGALISRSGVRIAERVLFRRALLICSGLYINLAMLAIEILVWKFSDDDLQKWCKHCAFGKNKHQRSLSVKSQAINYENALMEVI
jgi:hypothetical protein